MDEIQKHKQMILDCGFNFQLNCTTDGSVFLSICDGFNTFEFDCASEEEAFLGAFERIGLKFEADSEPKASLMVDNHLKFKANVDGVLSSIGTMLIEKNIKYGNSALNPLRVFSKTDSVEQLKVRIDDKLSRVSNQNSDEDEDVVNDLIGYLVLLKIAIKGESK